MVQVKSFFDRFSLRAGSIFILSLYVVLGFIFLIAENKFSHEYEFVSISVLACTLLAMIFCAIGLAGIFMKKVSLLVPFLFLELVFLILAVVSFIIYPFVNKFPISNAINGLAHINQGVFVILFPMSQAFGAYFWIVVYSYYMKELKEGSAPRRSDI